MSRSLISRSPDLKALADDGYDVGIVSGHLVIRDVPLRQYQEAGNTGCPGVDAGSSWRHYDPAEYPCSHVLRASTPAIGTGANSRKSNAEAIAK